MDPRPIVALGRRLLGDTYLDRALIGDRTLARDGHGGWTETWVDRARPVACRYVARQMDVLADAEPRVGLGEFASPEGVAVLFPVGTDIAEGDRIVNPASARKWIVTASPTPESALQTSVRVLVREVD